MLHPDLTLSPPTQGDAELLQETREKVLQASVPDNTHPAPSCGVLGKRHPALPKEAETVPCTAEGTQLAPSPTTKMV